MLQEINHNQKAKVAVCPMSTTASDLSWWRTWTSSWWANVYF
ncbi:Trp operon leader peptide [Vibrio nereis]|nr:Trp operon leader peptide [Vibrio nereis]